MFYGNDFLVNSTCDRLSFGFSNYLIPFVKMS